MAAAIYEQVYARTQKFAQTTVNLLQREIVSALIQQSLSKDLLNKSQLLSQYNEAEIAVRSDHGHVAKLTLRLYEEKISDKIESIKKLSYDERNTGLCIAFKTW